MIVSRLCISRKMMMVTGWLMSLMCLAGALRYKDRTCEWGMAPQPEPFTYFDKRIRINLRCDTTTDHGGWIYVQRRSSTGMDFNRNWQEYKWGFGGHYNNFWLGVEYIHNLTSVGEWELRFDIEDNGKWYYVYYAMIHVESEEKGYLLHLYKPYRGNFTDPTALNCLSETKFSTFNNLQGNMCAKVRKSGWWYSGHSGCDKWIICSGVNINGVWGSTGTDGVWWQDRQRVYGWQHYWYGGNYRYFFRWPGVTEMKIRKRS